MPVPCRIAAVLAACLALAAAALAQEPEVEALTRAGLVEVTSLDPTIRIEMRYATPDNFTGRAVYPSGRCFLAREAAEGLVMVQARLRRQGLGLLLYDCYRPFSAQKLLWELAPDKRFVARPVEEHGRPARGSRHNRGAAVDLTLVDTAGKELPMPTGFDDFSQKAARNYQGGDQTAQANSRLLEAAMVEGGFSPLASEWWHFDGPGWRSRPLLDLPLPPGH
ncbi:M15 family metallopeptidase [Desulfolutivibrio sulfoxidireducens]|uniref:M15 family metallopeptidase n=1 Tax=Desulfolutivibrio sulfoxidireducens TaxID=2773299 RepID=UPI00159E30E6|nr:M15 family metallopeptidase [Desulfolutivibrio sulfoxidireducens]QLA18766.1 peptidase M15 [Desulfolutivibrio sulfoxidireducens]